jgi:hypothetical protein
MFAGTPTSAGIAARSAGYDRHPQEQPMRDTMTPVRITPSLPFGGDPTDWRRRRCSRERGRVTGAIRGALLCGRPGAAVGPVAIGLVALRSRPRAPRRSSGRPTSAGLA